jgi:hypothetical protein
MRNEAMPFVIEDVELRHQEQRQNAIVITPRKQMVLGRDRIQRLKGPTSLNKVDRWLIAQAEARRGRARVVLFRACNTLNERVWQFDPSLSDAELEEAGYLLTCALVPFHRRLLAVGIVLMVHTDWGVRECYAMRHGVRAREKELLSKIEGAPSLVNQVDAWVLNNMLLHVALSLKHVTERLLPMHLGMVERRWAQVLPLLGRLPNSTID